MLTIKSVIIIQLLIISPLEYPRIQTVRLALVEVEEQRKDEAEEEKSDWQPFEVTAYTAGYESTGKRQGDPYYGITASGEPVKEGVTVACPPSMPFGTVIEIEGIGQRICQDRGGAITEGRLDVYFDDLNDALNFGRQTRNVRIVEEVEEMGERKIHILEDGCLGGVLREYVEVDRRLEPTDIIHIDDQRYRMVERRAEIGETIISLDEDATEKHEYSVGDILTVEDAYKSGRYYCVSFLNGRAFWSTDQYRVLEPIEDEPITVDESQAHPQVIDMLANLSRRIVALEKQTAKLEQVPTRESIEKLLKEVLDLIYDSAEE